MGILVYSLNEAAAMKLTLVVLTVLLGVAVSSPLTDKVDSLLENLLASINKRNNGPGASPGSPTEQPEGDNGPMSGSGKITDKDGNEEKPEGQGPTSGSGSEGPPPKSSEGDSAEDSAEEKKIKVGLQKGMKKDMGAMRKFNQFCKFNLTKEDRFRPVSMAEVGRVFVRINRVFTKLATKFKSHETILEKIEEMEEDDESTEKHAELMKKLGEVPEQGLLMEVICALGSIKMVIARAKFVGISKEDFPEVRNCHRTCGQLVSMLRVLRKNHIRTVSKGKQTEMPTVNVTALKDNVEAVYRCMKGHVMGVKSLLDNGKKTYEASAQRPKASDVFLMITAMEHIIEGLGIRGAQLHACSKILYKFSEGQQKPKPQPTGAPAPGSDDIRSLLTALRSF